MGKNGVVDKNEARGSEQPALIFSTAETWADVNPDWPEEPIQRQASYGLGATRWQTSWHHVLPHAMPGILTGTILAMSRAIGETAPLVVVGASTFITVDPAGPFSKFTTLPIQIYQWTSRPQGEFRNIAAAAILVLLALLLTLNATAVLLRSHYSRRRT